MENRTKKILSTIGLAVVLIFCMALITQTIGLSQEGFDSKPVLEQWFFYAPIGGVYLFGVLLIFIFELYTKKSDERYGSGVGFADQGELPGVSMFKKYSSFQIFFASVIIFGVIGMVVLLNKQTAFTGIGLIPQQFTAINSLIFSSMLVPASENLGAAFLIAFSLFLARKYCRRENVSRANFLMFVFILIPLVVGMYGLSNHMLRYGGLDQSLIVVFFFWMLGALITLLTDSFIPFWCMHIFNNFFFDLKRFTSNESILVWSGLVFVLMAVTYFLIYIKGGKKVYQNAE